MWPLRPRIVFLAGPSKCLRPVAARGRLPDLSQPKEPARSHHDSFRLAVHCCAPMLRALCDELRKIAQLQIAARSANGSRARRNPQSSLPTLMTSCSGPVRVVVHIHFNRRAPHADRPCIGTRVPQASPRRPQDVRDRARRRSTGGKRLAGRTRSSASQPQAATTRLPTDPSVLALVENLAKASPGECNLHQLDSKVIMFSHGA